MKTKLYIVTFASAFILFSSCSHKPVKSETSPLAQVIPSPSEELALPNCPEGGCKGLTIDEYLNQIVLPRVVHSHLVHDCFLLKKRATKKELAPGYLNFRFEMKLIPEGDKVVVDNVYLSSFTNVPEWTKPCLKAGYSKFTFPPFSDPKLQSTSAFGTINMSWDPKKK